MEYSIVIPVYNSTATLKLLCGRIAKAFEGISSLYEIILVDDSSTIPGAWKIMKELRHSDTRIKIIQLRTNHGQQKAVLCGLMFSRGKYIITMDDDLQHPPEEIPKLIEMIINDNEVDAVFGVPDENGKKHGIFRNIGSYLVNKIDEIILNKPKGIVRGSFRIIRQEIVKDIIKIANDSLAIGSLILSVTQRVENVKVRHEARKEGRSGYGPFKLIKLSLDNILNYSSLPLKLVAVIGMCYFISSIVFSSLIVFRKIIFGINVPGWSSLLVLQLLSSGIIMGGLGIIGEYLIRIVKNWQGQGVIVFIRQIFIANHLEDNELIQ